MEANDLKKKIKVNPILLIIATLIASIALGMVFKSNVDTKNTLRDTYELVDTSLALYPQKVKAVLDTPVEITKLYNQNQLVGIITDSSRLDTLFNEVYEKEYKEQFPDSKLGFVQDIYQTTELSYNVYENRDDDIFSYIYDSDLIAIEADKISFSNGAIIYVKNRQDFIQARKEFILGFISESSYNRLINNEKIPALETYGTQDVGFEVRETITMSKGMATIDDIMLTETEILNFLSFGYQPAINEYTVQEFDTIEGIAWLNEMTPNQLLSINKNDISEINQVLKPGTQLNIAKFNSPLTVVISEERLVSEKIFPQDIIYREDPSLREGLTRVEKYESVGYEDVLYRDVYENDVSVSSTRISSKVTKEPVQGIIYVGTYVEPKVGSGNFRWPMNNARLTCGWYCYSGHSAADFQSRSNRGYGPILASDRGVVVTNTFHSEYGYYIIIDHNNGFRTLYAHMEGPAYFPVGATVRQGEQIGYVGMTGRTTGPHVHFVIYYNGRPVNPCTYVGC